MPLDRPTLTELRERVLADIAQRNPGADPLLRASVLNVLGEVLAGAAHEIYGSLDTAVRDLFPDTADAEALLRWGRLQGVDELGAVASTGTATVLGTNGKVIPGGTVLQSGEGVEYYVTVQAVVAAGQATLILEATDAGAAGDAAALDVLSFVSPIAGVASTATVDAGGLTGGVDPEGTESYRERVLEAMSKPAQGGNADDWDRWVRDHPTLDVTRWWVTPPPSGMDVVSVAFVLDNLVPITPDAAALTSMQSHLDALRPVGSTVAVGAPALETLDLSITISPSTAEVQAAVTAELEDLLRREAAPGTTLLISHIREAISVAAGETDHDVTSPVGDVTPAAAGNLFVLGTITWS